MSKEGMLEKLEALEARYHDYGTQLSDPSVIADQKKFQQLNKAYKDLQEIVEATVKFRALSKNIEEAKEVLANDKDEDFRAMAKAELEELEPALQKLDEHIQMLMIPKDPEDSKPAILEVRAGTGGDEASIFAGDLLRMYMRFCERKGWKIALLSEAEGTVG